MQLSDLPEPTWDPIGIETIPTVDLELALIRARQLRAVVEAAEVDLNAERVRRIKRLT